MKHEIETIHIFQTNHTRLIHAHKIVWFPKIPLNGKSAPTWVLYRIFLRSNYRTLTPLSRSEMHKSCSKVQNARTSSSKHRKFVAKKRKSNNQIPSMKQHFQIRINSTNILICSQVTRQINIWNTNFINIE